MNEVGRTRRWAGLILSSSPDPQASPEDIVQRSLTKIASELRRTADLIQEHSPVRANELRQQAESYEDWRRAIPDSTQEYLVSLATLELAKNAVLIGKQDWQDIEQFMREILETQRKLRFLPDSQLEEFDQREGLLTRILGDNYDLLYDAIETLEVLGIEYEENLLGIQYNLFWLIGRESNIVLMRPLSEEAQVSRSLMEYRLTAHEVARQTLLEARQRKHTRGSVALRKLHNFVFASANLVDDGISQLQAFMKDQTIKPHVADLNNRRLNLQSDFRRIKSEDFDSSENVSRSEENLQQAEEKVIEAMLSYSAGIDD